MLLPQPSSMPAADRGDTKLRDCEEDVGTFFDTIALIESLHRLLHDVVKDELERLRFNGLNSAQALLLYRLGRQRIVVRELTAKGFYFGTNVTYNLNKLVEAGLLHRVRGANDRRLTYVSLTKNGEKIRYLLSKAMARKYKRLFEGCFDSDVDFILLNGHLRRLESFWLQKSSQNFP